MSSIRAILDLAQSMGLILGIAFFVAIVIWTYKDARKRTEDPIMVATFTAISMLPIFGVLIYMLVRPSEYIADVRERELEIRSLERQLGKHERCPYCKSHIEGDYLSCPVCTTKLRQSCTGCDKPLDPRWVMCPFCETDVPNADRSRNAPRGGSSSRGSGSSSRRGGSSSSSPKNSAGNSRERDARDGRSRRDQSNSRSNADASKRIDSSSRVTTSASTDSSASSSDSKRGGDLNVEPFGAGDTTRV